MKGAIVEAMLSGGLRRCEVLGLRLADVNIGERLDEILGACARSGLPHLSCQQLRHTCFMRLREAGMALEAIQAQAGHASIESTRIYVHLANDCLAGEYRQAFEAIDAQAVAVPQ